LREKSFAAAALLTAALCVLRIGYASPYAASWDAVDFALALQRFDLLAMQPHFPGYPYFVLAGKALLPWFGGDAVLALSAVGALAYATAVVPMYGLVRTTLPPWPAAGVAALLQSASYLGLAAAMPMSEAMAVALLWWFFWSVQAAWNAPRYSVRLLAPILFGLLMGVRLSYAAFGLLLLPLLWREWTGRSRPESTNKLRLRAVLFLAAALLSQLLWVGALVVTEGSLNGFLQLGLEFANGHFTDWGGAATADTSPALPVRFVRLVFYNLLWTGVCGGSVWNAIAIAVVTLIWFWSRYRHGRTRVQLPLPASLGWGLAACAAYLLWALFAQNIDKPRHILPLIGPLLWIGGVALYRLRQAYPVAAIGTLLFASQLLSGILLLYTLHTEPPATVAMHRYLAEREDEAFLLYTWEETRTLQYLGAEYAHKRVYTYALAEEERRVRPDRRVYVTSKVVEGFERQGVDVESTFRPVASFTSNGIIEPVYAEVVLYEWE
jgi:hypothetical protein